MALDGLRVLFMGTPDFAVPTLAGIVDAGCDVVGVVSQPDRPKGRGRQVSATPVAHFARARGLPVYQWPRLNQSSYETVRQLEPDVTVVIAYGKILPQRYLDLPKFGCLNVHASLLPRLRGAAPIQWAVIRGHRQTGITIMRMDAGMDTGDIGVQLETDIGPHETAGELHDRLASLGATALVQALDLLVAARLEFRGQRHDAATMAPRLSKSDGLLDWTQSAQVIHDHVRGMSPWPGAYVPGPDGAWKIHEVRVRDVSGEPGDVVQITDDGPVVGCGTGSVLVTRLQRPGRRPVAGADFLRGTQVDIGCPLVGRPS
ncbi:MAG: methionyl-tRNA formyltransferase [Myxococcota bacterium]|nr:methionyl-tRNA formyltransferase [Myxococcota bacterium]